MSGSVTPPVTPATPVKVPGSFFYDNTASIAAALDLQTAIAQASVLLTQAVPELQQTLTTAQQTLAAAQQALPLAQQAVNNANYFLSGDLAGLPTSPAGLASGSSWNNGGAVSIVP